MFELVQLESYQGGGTYCKRLYTHFVDGTPDKAADVILCENGSYFLGEKGYYFSMKLFFIPFENSVR